MNDFELFCRNATDRQLENIIKKEWDAGRLDDYRAAKREAKRRGWEVNRGERIS